MKKHHYSIKNYINNTFVVSLLIISTVCCYLSYKINSSNTDKHYQSTAVAYANCVADLIDADYLNSYCQLVTTDEYIATYNRAQRNSNEKILLDYLESQDMLDGYFNLRSVISTMDNSIPDINGLYIISNDVCIMDSTHMDILEFSDKEVNDNNEIMINPDGVSGFVPSVVPILDSNGNIVAYVECDLDATGPIMGRRVAGAVIVAISLVVGILVTFLSQIIIKNKIINPMNEMIYGIQNFKPDKNTTLETANILTMNFKNKSELSDIYDSIRENQISIVNMLQSINDKNEKINDLSIKTNKDALTGVGNVNAYISKTSALNSHMKNFAIIMADVNNLKQINDTYGHEIGDEYLKGCCNILCTIFSHSPIFRIGGDEFIIVVQNQDFTNRVALFNKAQQEFRKSFEQEDKELYERYSVSIGLAEVDEKDASVDMIMRRADESMYAEKEKFRKKYGSYR